MFSNKNFLKLLVIVLLAYAIGREGILSFLGT